MAPRRVEIVSSHEPWSSYTLEDGTTVRFKQAAIAISIDDDVKDQDGNPTIFIKASPIVDAVFPKPKGKAP